MAIGLSAAACNVDAIEDYVNDNFGTGGGDAASTTGSDSSSSQSSSSAGTSGSTTAGTGGADASSGVGGSGAGGDAGTGGGDAGGDAGTGGGTTTGGTGGAGGTGGGGAPPADPACGPDTATYAQVRPILDSCANQYCHGSPTAPSAGLDLRLDTAVGSLVNQGASSCSTEHALVVPFMPSSSYLLNKLNDVDLCDPDESKMPPGGSLSDAELKTITDWICAGAPAD
ncbi:MULTISPECIES: hypothetical protein [Sorangium]|uniref:hypothetical protein n=1 Tax=Sorangium TaxID=39643 RepID=UPI003D9C385B